MTRFRDSIYHRILEGDLAGIRDGVVGLVPHFESALRFIRHLPESKLAFAYAPGKWTMAEVIGHLLDTRIVFLNRLLYITRGDPAPLPPFDEQIWVRNAGHGKLKLEDLAGLYSGGSALIAATVRTLPAGTLSREGVANGILITAEEILLYLMAHEMHHLMVLDERYLQGRVPAE